ncbi:MAG: hypothetical protein H6Q89_761 [Myxococcaceae bacterium]|nr:hypothetical protein [Myxococcaceae bacterium]
MVKPHYDDDDDDKVLLPGQFKFKEWDCPGCDANNPVDPPVGHGDEVLCNYCGCDYQVIVSDELKVKFRAL